MKMVVIRHNDDQNIVVSSSAVAAFNDKAFVRALSNSICCPVTTLYADIAQSFFFLFVVSHII